MSGLQRLSQESSRTYVTSTPVSSFERATSSLSISEINVADKNSNGNQASGSSPKESAERGANRKRNRSPSTEKSGRTSTNSIFDGSFYSRLSHLGLTDANETSYETPKKKRKIRAKPKGDDLAVFYPKDDQSLFYRLVNEPDNIEYIVQEILEGYKHNETETLKSVIELFIAVSGFQNYKVKHFDLTTKNDFKTVEDLHKHITKPLHDGKYLFRGKSDWSKMAIADIKSFVRILILRAHKAKILYEPSFTTKIIGFLKCCTSSNIRSLIHTATVILLKIGTAFLEILENVQTLATKSRGVKKRFGDRKEFILNLMQLITTTFFNISCIPDAQLFELRADCAREVFYWFILRPKGYLKPVFLHKFMHLVVDESKDVRVTAIETATTLLKQKSVKQYIQPILQTLNDNIEKRLYDLNVDVSKAAIEYLTTAELYFPKSVTGKACSNVLNAIYCGYYPHALAAAKFVYVRFKNDKNSEKDFLLHLCKINKLESKRTSLLIEAMIDVSAELQDFELIIQMISDDQQSDETKIDLVIIMCHAMCQLIRGKSKIPRIKGRNSPGTANVVKMCTQIFCNNCYELLNYFQEESEVFLELVEIFYELDYEIVLSPENMKNMKNVAKLLCYTSMRNDSKKLKVEISLYFDFLSKIMSTSYSIIREVMSKFKQFVTTNCIEKLRGIMSEIETNSDELNNVERCLIDLSSLIIHNDISDILEWNFIYQYLLQQEYSSPKMTKHLLIICKHLLVHKIKNLSNADYSEKVEYDILQVERDISAYIDTAFEYLRSSDENKIIIAAYRNICDLYVELNTIFKQIQRFRGDTLGIFSPIISTIDHIRMLEFVLEKFVFTKEPVGIPLKKRRIFLQKFITLILEKLLGYDHLLDLFQHFFMFEEDFGVMFEDTLKVLRKRSDRYINYLIYNTLKLNFEKLVASKTKFDFNDASSLQLRSLSKKFTISLPGFNFKEVIQCALIHVKISDKLPFLKFMSYLCRNLLKSDRKELLKNLSENFSEEEINSNRQLMDFKVSLKAKKIGQKLVRQVSADEESPSSVASSQDANEYDENMTIDESSD